MKVTRKHTGVTIILVVVYIMTSCIGFEPERVFKVDTDQVTDITGISSVAQGSVIDLGENEIDQHGFCYSKNPNPTVDANDGIVHLGSISKVAKFTGSISNLEAETNYYIKAYLTNSESTTYGEELLFSTSVLKINSLALVYTTSATLVTETTASIGGNVTDSGGTSVSETGVYYGTSSDPKTTGTKIIISSGTGSFKTDLTALTIGTKYYFIAYAVNSAGTSYGEEYNFTTGQINNPAVSTVDATSVTQTSAIVGGNVLDDGGGTIVDRGVYYGTSSDPQSTGTKVPMGDGAGTFSGTLSGLLEGVKYYFVAYATNSAGTAYGITRSFTTNETILKPTVTTISATGVAETSAELGGNVTDDGGGSVIDRGFYYGTSSDPASSGTKVPRGSGTGPFSTILTSLSPGTTYYYVAYASNSEGQGYGNVLDFTTDIFTPSVTSTIANSVTETSAVVGGNVIDNGGGTISERGVYYGTSSNPQDAGAKVPIGSGNGEFSHTLTGLSSGTRYYYVAYAINSKGQSIGTTLDFTTDSPINTVTDRDGNKYQTVVIGTQTWMQENLKTTRYADGTYIPLVSSQSEWSNLASSSKAYCYYDNNTGNGDTYGALYTWAAAMNGSSSSSSIPSGVQGVCPSGWHLPSDDEWKQLEMYLGMSQLEADKTSFRGGDEGGKLKEKDYTHWQNPNTLATNSSGFTALPGGYRLDSGTFGYLFTVVSYWTATQNSTTEAWNRSLHHDNAQVYRNFYTKNRGYYVRCIRD